MPMVRAMRLLNAIEAGTLTGSGLETLLTDDPSRLGELNVLLGMRGQARRMAASSVTMTAIAASAKATEAVAGSSVAMDEVFASTQALQKMAANFAASATARLAMWNSDALLAGIQKNNTALETMMAASGAVSTSAGSGTTIVAQGTKIILLRRRYSATPNEILKWTRTNGNLPGYNSTAIKYGPSYENLGTGPVADDATGNNVRACNGLYSVHSAGTIYVRYLPV